jgi:hypothetical protein
MRKEKLDPFLEMKAEELIDNVRLNEKIPILVMISHSASSDKLMKITNLGVRILGQGRVHTADLDITQIDKLTEMDEVLHLEMSRKLKLLSTDSR